MRKAVFLFLFITLGVGLWFVAQKPQDQVAETTPHTETSRRSDEVPAPNLQDSKVEEPALAQQAGKPQGSVLISAPNGHGPTGVNIDISQVEPNPDSETASSVKEKNSVKEASSIAELMSQKLDLSDPKKRAEVVEQVRRLEEAQMQETRLKAERLGIPMIVHEPGGTKAILVGFDGDLPRYRADHNANAAISLGVNLVRSTAPYNVNGNGMKVGLWEAGGIPRVSHGEFNTNRVKIADGSTTVTDHATHVAGTIIARGATAAALGMAPLAEIAAYDSTNDNSEMLAIGAATAGDAGKIYISNHSYGFISGWRPETATWYGTFSDDGNPANDVETRFGRYDSTSTAMDGMLYNLPYFLPFMSSGNDRNDDPPATGGTWYLSSGGAARTYNPAQHPAGDGVYKNGYDNLDNEKVCKNVITIGAANDAVLSGNRNVAAGTLTAFSSTGPTDDGRIKPDVVANGASVYSAMSSSDSTYGSMSGTSMASPNACGAALLLIDYFQQRFPGQSMRASTLKGLIIHTADDVGRPGPDYEYGWGLMNAKAAADVIKAEADDLSKQQISEHALAQGKTDEHRFYWNGVDPIRVTLCWTDPSGSANNSNDDRTPDLVNDLNIKVIAPNGNVHLPYVMLYVGNWQSSQLTAAAVRGVNKVDTVEQVLVAAPDQEGQYVVSVNHTGNLTYGPQSYSLIVTGGIWSGALTVSPNEHLSVKGFRGGPFSPNSKSYQLLNKATEQVTWTATSSQPWISVSPTSGVLSAGGEQQAAILFNSQAATLSDGIHTADISLTNSMDGVVEVRRVALEVSGEAPQIRVSDSGGQILLPNSLLNLGSLTLGAGPSDMNIVVSNVNPDSFLELEAPTISGDDAAAFSIVGGLSSNLLENEDIVSLKIRFMPRHTGEHVATLRLPSNDPSQPIFFLELRGTGVPVPGPNQQIIVGSIPPQKNTSTGITLPTVSTSGLLLSYEILAGPVTLDPSGRLIPSGTGAVTLRITQAGNEMYAAAEPVTITFTISNEVPQFQSISTSRNGSFTLAIDTQGYLWSWGSGASLLGHGGTSTTRYTPETVDVPNRWKMVSAGGTFSLGIKSDGTLWSWGSNLYGQLGIGTTATSSVPVRVSSDQWVHITTALEHALAIKSDGSLWGWGNNGSGRIGDGTTTNRLSPVQLGTDFDWESVSSGQSHNLAIKKDGSLWAWGVGTSGELGTGGTVSSSTPVRIGTSVDWKTVSAGGLFSLAIKRNGTLWGWGSGWNGQLGNGTLEQPSQLTPQQMGSDTNWVGISAGLSCSVGRKNDGSVWTWGRNSEGQIGNGNRVHQPVPFRVNRTGDDWLAITAGNSVMYALDADGTLIGWGDGSGYTGKHAKQLTKAVDARSWSQYSQAGGHTLLISEDTSLWAFGQNSFGQIGNNTSISQDIVQINSGDNWAKIRAGGDHSGGIRQNGDLWMWGYNGFGQVGDGSSTNRHTPRPLTGSTWKELALGANHSVAIRTNGTLWGWGSNGSGQLGDGTTVNKSIPTQAGTESNWEKLAAGTLGTVAIKTDGSLWVAGSLSLVGVGGSSFVRIGTENNWDQISVGGSSFFALKKDGTLWAWGTNTSGQLGLGDVTNRTTLTRVGTGNDWAQVSASSTWTAAIKKDGTLWAWGNNVTYQQGLAIDGSISSPRQIGNTTGWVWVEAGNVSIVAKRADGSLWTGGFSGGFRLTTASGRSAFAVVPVMSKLQPQSVLPWSSGHRSSQIKASSGLPVNLEIVSGSATVQGNVLTLTGPIGSTVRYMAWQKGDETAWDSSVPMEFSITSQRIDLSQISVQTCGVPLTLPAQASSGLPITYTVVEGAELVQVNGTMLNFVGAGRVTLHASQNGGSGYAAAESLVRSFDVVKVSQILTWGESLPSQVSHAAAISLSAASDRGLAPVIFIVKSGPGVIDGSVLRFSGIGDVVVEATHPGNAAVLSATIERTFTVYNTVPIAVAASFSINEDTVLVDVLRGIDTESTPLTFTAMSQPLHGILSLQSNGTFSYTPAPNFFGEDSFTFKVNDGMDDSAVTFARITVRPVNDAPVAIAQNIAAEEGVATPITLQGTDIETPYLQFAVTQNPMGGRLSGIPPHLTYVSTLGFEGTDSFTFTVSDGALIAEASVTIQVSPVGVVIVTPPISKKVSVTDRVEMSVTATGTNPIEYQWFKDDALLTGKTERTLTFSSVAESDLGSYKVKVSNRVSSAMSSSASLTVIGDTVEIIEQPEHRLATAGQDAVFSVTALGRPPLKYQWRKNGKALSGQTGRELRLPAVKLSDAAAYSVQVKGSAIERESNVAQLGVAEAGGGKLVITKGAKASWSFQVAGKDLRFQWHRDGETLSSRGTVSPDGKKISLNKVELEDAGTYICTVSGPGGTLEGGIRVLNIVSEAPDITPLKSGDRLPSSQIGHEYVYQVPVDLNEHRVPETFTATGLPVGLKINPSTGVISGIATVSSDKDYKVKITAKNGSGSDSVDVLLKVAGLPDNVAGVYVAPIPRHNFNDDLGGRLDLTVTSSGAFSGKLTMGSRKPMSFKKGVIKTSLEVGVMPQGEVEIPQLKPLPPLKLHFKVDLATSRIVEAGLSDGGASLPFDGWKNVWHAKLKPADAMDGLYNAGLEWTTQLTESEERPLGTGFVSFNAAKTGLLKLAGKLPDGESVLGSTFLGPQGQVLVYQTLYKSATKGSLVGRMQVGLGTHATDDKDNTVSGLVTWSHPVILGGKLYPQGFDPLPMNVVGGRYLAPQSPTILWGLADRVGNARLSFSGAEIQDAFLSPQTIFQISSKHKIVLPKVGSEQNPTSLSLQINPKTGQFKGTFALTDSPSFVVKAPIKRSVNFLGLIYPGSEGSGGYGYFMLPRLPENSQQPAKNTPIFSGRVILKAP